MSDPGQNRSEKAEQDAPKHKKETLSSQWGRAGSALGDLAGSVGRQIREDLGEDGDASLRRLRGEASEAADAVRAADSRDDYLEAGRDFARDAGGFIRELAGSVRDAVSEARGSEQGEEVKVAFAGVVESSRDRIDDATDAMRARRQQRKEEAADGSDETTAPEPDIIDGEVISVEEDSPNL